MGTCSVDTNKNQRQHNNKYALNTKEGVKMLLEDIPYLEIRKYYEADFDASDILIDLETAKNIAIKEYRLTEKQIRAAELLYIEGYTREDAGSVMGISDTTVHIHGDKACVKLAKVFKSWNYNEVS